MEEELIVRGVIAGEPSATEAFVHKHRADIEKTVRGSHVPPSDAPDVVQDVLIEALRQLAEGRFEQRSTLRTWVARITRGRIVDYWRGRSRRGLNQLVSIDNVDADAVWFGTDAGQEAHLLVEEALKAMPFRLSLVIRLRHREDMSIPDLARVLNRSESRTRSIVTEAQRVFREYVCGVEKTPPTRRLKDQGA